VSNKPLGPDYTVEYPLNVRLTSCKFRCTKCGKWKPAAQVGLRCVTNAAGDDIIRNQPQCKSCRSTKAKLRVVK
jgi:hypothetical protein